MRYIEKRPVGSRAEYQNSQTKYSTNCLYNQAKKALPSPASVLAMLGLEVPKRKNGRGYFVIKCLFHNDNEPSLNIHSKNGHYNCFSCGARGDLISFYMRVTGKLYKDAIHNLLKWRA